MNDVIFLIPAKNTTEIPRHLRVVQRDHLVTSNPIQGERDLAIACCDRKV